MKHSAENPASPQHREAGLSLLEALVASSIIIMVTMTLLAIRTTAMKDALHADNWRIARELAETRLSELMAGAHESQPEGNDRMPPRDEGLADRGFELQIVYGQSSIDAVRSQIQENESMAGSDEEGWDTDRFAMQRERDMLRRAQREGVNRWELEERLLEEEQARLEEQQAPSETDTEEVAVFVFFPKADPFEEGEEVYELRARISTLAWSGMTPDEAERFAEAQGLDGAGDAGAGPGGNAGNPAGGNQGGGR